ncbi:MAG TPA: KR domain-containing protein, partial [Micromonospora sp.]
VAATVSPAVHTLDLLPDLAAAVVFSSVSGVWGTGEHAAFAAANAHLDALAERRRADGRPVTSVAWGVWNTVDPTTADAALAEAVARPGRHGVPLLDPDRALAALDRVTRDAETGLVVADVDWSRFAPLFTSARPTRLFVEVVAVSEPAVEEPSSVGPVGLRERLVGLSGVDRERVLVDLVRGHAAVALGHGDGGVVDVDRPFKELGFDSLIAVELRNRLSSVTGLVLPPTLVFDYPTPAAVAGYLASRLGDGERITAGSVHARLKAIEDAVSAASLTEDERRGIAAQLREFLDRWHGTPASGEPESAVAIEDASDDELFEFIHKELGRPSVG